MIDYRQLGSGEEKGEIKGEVREGLFLFDDGWIWDQAHGLLEIPEPF